METPNWLPSQQHINRSLAGIVCAGALLGAANPALAAPVDATAMTINGLALSAQQDSNGKVPVHAGKQKFRYTGYGQTCSNAEWFIKLEGSEEWHNFDHTKYAERVIHRPGTHQLKLTVDGYNNWFTFCFHEGEYSETIVDLKIDQGSYTQTKYPIMVVPGVLAYDSINVLIDRIDYFYGVAETIEETSDHLVHTFSLNPWQDTVDRGEDLARKIIHQVESSGPLHQADPDHYPPAFDKVNLLAHSHGATTSRVALRHLKEFYDRDYVASLTTVAGPHFGTPTADGANRALEEWGLVGDTLEAILVPTFHGIGCLLATMAGDAQYCGNMNIMDVLQDFTQGDMYAFNTEQYPSYGVPTGGKYYGNAIPEADRVNAFYEGYGRGLYDDWFATTKTTVDVPQPNGSVAQLDMVIGNGLGQQAQFGDADAVQYYSFSGDAPSSSMPVDAPLSDDTFLENVFCLGDEIPTDILMDSVLCVFNSFYGAMYWNRMEVPSEDQFAAGAPEWIPHDGFIPVDSAKFGVYLGTHYWNHVDEQNQFLGLIPSVDPQGNTVANPKFIYSEHANLLQKAGL